MTLAADLDRARNGHVYDFYGHAGKPGSSWLPVSTAHYLLEGEADPPPVILHRDDGKALLYRAKSHSISAEPEAGKGWAAMLATAEVLTTGGTAIYIDHEDTPPAVFARLCRGMGVAAGDVLSRFHYVGPEERLPNPAFIEALLVLEPDLVVIDGVTEAMALQGLDPLSNADVAGYLNLIVRPFKTRGAAVVLIDHVTKDRESRGRYAIGAQHKLAGIDVGYTLEVIEPFGRGREGLVKVVVTKDRPGHIRQHAEGGKRVGLMRLSSHDDGSVSVAIEPPEQLEGPWRPTVLMERISRYVEENPGATKNAIEQDVKGKTAALREALQHLIADGYVSREKGARGALEHESLRPFRAETSTPGPTSPPLRPVEVANDLDPSPLPIGGEATVAATRPTPTSTPSPT